MITLAVAPSVCDLRHCVSAGGGSLGGVGSFKEISFVLALSSTISSQETNSHQNTVVQLLADDPHPIL